MSHDDRLPTPTAIDIFLPIIMLPVAVADVHAVVIDMALFEI